MNTKTCKRCGWVYPATQLGNKCIICGELFDIVVCRACGKIVSGKDKVSKRNLCRECHNAEERAHMKTYNVRHKKKLDDRFQAWLSKVKQVPSSYSTLTEEQWMAACKHFDGCARCNSTDIDTRGFFISFDIGGRYCDWNIIPLCDDCARRWSLDGNPFSRAEQRDNREAVQRLYRDNLENIIEYLEVKLDAAIEQRRDSSSE